MGKQQQQQKSGGGDGAKHRRSRPGGAGPRGWDSGRLREPGLDAAGGGGRAPRPRLPLPVWPSTWRRPPGEVWGFLPQLFRNSLKGALRVRPGCAVHARTQWGSRHVLFNSRQKGERGRRGAGQVKCWPRVPDTRLSWAKVQPRLRPPWDGKARSVFLRTERGGEARPVARGTRPPVPGEPSDLFSYRPPGARDTGRRFCRHNPGAAPSHTRDSDVNPPSPPS